MYEPGVSKDCVAKSTFMSPDVVIGVFVIPMLPPVEVNPTDVTDPEPDAPFIVKSPALSNVKSIPVPGITFTLLVLVTVESSVFFN